jgi:hypothetical protein
MKVSDMEDVNSQVANVVCNWYLLGNISEDEMYENLLGLFKDEKKSRAIGNVFKTYDKPTYDYKKRIQDMSNIEYIIDCIKSPFIRKEGCGGFSYDSIINGKEMKYFFEPYIKSHGIFSSIFLIVAQLLKVRSRKNEYLLRRLK